jgi:hypothetical protein
MRRQRRSYPQHPFPLITVAGGDPRLEFPQDHRLSKQQQWLLNHIRQGARILFDMTQKRALLYSFKRGVEHLAEITIRALSGLLKTGLLAPTARDGRLIHYVYAG